MRDNIPDQWELDSLNALERSML